MADSWGRPHSTNQEHLNSFKPIFLPSWPPQPHRQSRTYVLLPSLARPNSFPFPSSNGFDLGDRAKCPALLTTPCDAFADTHTRTRQRKRAESARAIVGTLLCLLSLSTAATINTPERPPGHRVPRRPNGAKSPSPTPFGFKFIRVTLRQREIISHLSQPLSRIRAARLFSRCGAPP